jgi:hypothetical protein
MSKEIFVAYWGGYFDSPLTLDKIPDYVDIVILAFASPDIKNGHSILITDFLCSKYSDQTIIEWVKLIQARGQKVLMSILDTPQTHWNNLNIKEFIISMKQIVIDKWGCDGIDIDAESGMPDNVYVQYFVELVQEVRKAIGYDKLLTYTCYTGTEGPDGSILKETKTDINWINLMAYFDNIQGMMDLYKDYSTIMENNITVGVKAGTDFTNLNEVKQLCRWEPDPYKFELVIVKNKPRRRTENLKHEEQNTQGQNIQEQDIQEQNTIEEQDDLTDKYPICVIQYKKGMMLWTLNRDCPSFTGRPNWTWTQTINDNLPKEDTY